MVSAVFYILFLVAAGSFEAAAAWQVWRWRKKGGANGLGFVFTGLALLSMVSWAAAGMEIVYLVRDKGRAEFEAWVVFEDVAHGLIDGAYVICLLAMTAGIWHLRPIFKGESCSADS